MDDVPVCENWEEREMGLRVSSTNELFSLERRGVRKGGEVQVTARGGRRKEEKTGMHVPMPPSREGVCLGGREMRQAVRPLSLSLIVQRKRSRCRCRWG